ncbi:MAG: G5 domain-containing protein [Eubacterium sp.]
MINQSGAVGFKGISRAVVTAVIAFIVAIIVFATTAFADLASEYKVEIAVDNNKFVITTNETEPIEILSQANVILAESDKLDISAFRSGEGGTIKVDKLNKINVKFDGVISTYDVYGDTVGEAFNELGITVNSNDKTNYALTDNVTDGMVIEIKSAMSVSLKADGEKTKYAIYQGTVADLLKLAQIELGDEDYTKPSLDTELKANMSVEVFRVEYKEKTETEQTAFKTTQKKDSSLAQGTEKVTKKGVNGEDEVTYKVKYVNGKEESRQELSRKTIKEPVNQIVTVGTKKTSGAEVKSNGVQSKNGYSVGQQIKGKYTHYCACGVCGSGSGVTASGKKVYNGMANPYYIACNWLPLGSVVNVDGTNYTVVDRGGSGLSTVGRIDIFTPEGHQACYRYGTGSCNLTIVRLGW